jgi:hypothetical protein
MSQHAAALAIYRDGDTTAARRMSAAFGFSVQTWSDCLLRKSWMTPAGFAAATTLLIEQRDAAAAVAERSAQSVREPDD